MIQQSDIPRLVFEALWRADFEIQQGQAEEDEGEWYTLTYAEKQRQHFEPVRIVVDASEILADYGTKFRVVEIGTPDGNCVRIRVAKYIEQDKPRVLADSLVDDSVRVVYEALCKTDPTLVAYEQLGQAKLRILETQLNTLRLTMKM